MAHITVRIRAEAGGTFVVSSDDTGECAPAVSFQEAERIASRMFWSYQATRVVGVVDETAD